MTSSSLTLSQHPEAAQYEGAGASYAQPRDDTARKVFSGALAFFLVVAVARLHLVVIPQLAVIPLAKLAALVLVITAWAALSREEVVRAYSTPMARAFGLIVVLAVVGVPFALWPGGTVGDLQERFVPMVFLFAIGSVGLMHRGTRQVCATALILAIGIDSIQVLRAVHTVQGRAMLGGGLDPNDTAALIVSTIPIALLLAGQRGALRRVLFTGVALLGVAALVKTGSRGGMVALVAMALALIVVSRGRQRRNYILLVALGAGLVGAVASDQLSERFKSVFNPKADYNTYEEDGRIAIWKRGIGYMASNPVLGVGFLNFQLAEGQLSSMAKDPLRRRGVREAAAHNAYVQIGAELGVGGLLAFLTMVGGSLIGCWRLARRRDPDADPFVTSWATAGFVGLAGLSVAAVFLSLAYHSMLLFTAALCTAIVAAGARSSRAVAGAPAAPGAAAAMPAPGWRTRRSASLVHTPPAFTPVAPPRVTRPPAPPMPLRGRRVGRRR